MEATAPPLKPSAYPKWLLLAFVLVWLVMAIKPYYFKNWVLENVLTVAFVGLLVWSHRRFPLSNVSYTFICAYLCLHTLGAHYSYSNVDYDRVFRAVFGRGLNEMMGWRRNHFDRFVHLCFGLLLSYPIREIFCRVAGARGFWGYYLPLDVTMSFSMLYELIEWAAAIAFGGELGQAYLGTQGDEWDAHRDMALATAGAAVTMGVVALINWKFDKDFDGEWRRSLEVKGLSPMGEVKLRELMKR